MNNIGFKIILSLPNATIVHTDLDQLRICKKDGVDIEHYIIFPRNQKPRLIFLDKTCII